jgi:Methylenetetrahydrofolate reductase.
MERYRGNPADMEKEGIDVTIELCRDLVKNGVNQFHFFTLNKPKVITAILDAIR